MVRSIAFVAVLAGLAFAAAATAAQANTLRFTFDSAADNNYSGMWGNLPLEGSGRPYSGEPNTEVIGFIDLDFSGAAPTIAGYEFAGTVPHGVPNEFFSGTTTPNIEMAFNFSPPGARPQEVAGNGAINLYTLFTFVTPYTDFDIASRPGYDHTDTTPYEFEAQLQMFLLRDVSGVPLGIRISRLDVTCPAARVGGTLGVTACNGFGLRTNRGSWDGTDANNATMGPAPEVSVVPLPAGAVLILTGLAGFAALRRRAA